MSSRARKVAWIVSGTVAGVLVLATIALLMISRTQQFEAFIRTRLVDAVEEATGGRAEVGSIETDLGHLRIVIRNFILHGTEPEGQAPLLQVDRLTLVAQLLPARDTILGIASVDIERPRVAVIVFPDGRTNIPNPKTKSETSDTPLETVVNLAIGRFQIVNGELRFQDQAMPFAATGEDLRARVDFDRLRQRYQGTLSVNPLKVQRGTAPELDVALSIPISIERDRAAISQSTIRTPQSTLTLSGEISNLNAPRVELNARGNLNLIELASAVGEPLHPGRNAPQVADVELEARMEPGEVQVSTLSVKLGSSLVDASGTFQNASFENGTANLHADLILNELAALMAPAADVRGTVAIQALARTQAQGQYSLDGSIRGTNLSYRDSSVALSGVELASTVQADQDQIIADPFRIDIAGGRAQLRAVVQQLNEYRITGGIAGLHLQPLLAAAGTRSSQLDAVISGPLEVRGAVKGTKLESASARLALTPAGRGLLLRGQLQPSYSASADSIDLGQSFLALPASRLDLSGSINRRLDVRFTSRNLNELSPVLAMSSTGQPPTIPIQLQAGGVASVQATVTGRLSSPVIAGQAQINRFRAAERRFDELSAGFIANASSVAISNGVLRGLQMEAQFSGSTGLVGWKPLNDQPISVEATLQKGDLRDVLALAGQTDIPARGALTAEVRASGTIGDPSGIAELHFRNGEAYGEPLDSIDARVEVAGTSVVVPSVRIASGAASATLNARFDHPPEVFSSGNLQGRIVANQVALEKFAAVREQARDLAGLLSTDLNVQGILNPPGSTPRMQLSALNGNASVRNLRSQNEALGDIAADLSTQGQEIAYRLTSNFGGSSIRADGSTQLTADYPTRASLDVRDLPVEKVLKITAQPQQDISGLLAMRGDVSGTMNAPTADLQFSLSRAVVYRQPITTAGGRLRYTPADMELQNLEVQSANNRVTGFGRFTHPANSFNTGDLSLTLNTNSLDLARITYLQEQKPGLTGTAQLALKMDGTYNATRTTMPIDLRSFSAQIQAQSLMQNGTNYGGLTLNAAQQGQVVNVQLDSDIAQSAIQARADVRMAENYPISAQLSLQKIQYSHWAALLGNESLSNRSFDALLEGTVRAQGPAMQPNQMTGSAEFTRAEAFTTPARGSLRTQGRRVSLQNDGPIRLALTPTGVQIQQARWTGPSTTIAVTGTAGLNDQTPLNLRVNAVADLKLLRDFSPDISSEGALNLDAAITGPVRQPIVNGKLELQDAAYQQTSMLNGISKANGIIEFNGSTATIRNLTAQSGGGNLTLNGNVTRTADVYRFDLQARGRGVRVRTESGASVVADTQLRLTGTDKSSLLSGDVNVRVVSFNTRTDVGSILTQAAPPVETPSAAPTLLNAMRLNITVRMGSTTTFRSTFAQNLEATADLTVRGTAQQPGMLGRIVLSQGELVFFGTKYTVNEGNIAFFNPSRIDPVLSLSLGTTARGVTVDLVVTGPVTNMNLSYRSDPPLQFSEIVALLGAGKVPTSDPVLLSRQPPAPEQSLPQMGASALLGAAIANPIAGQLQRVFGVTQLKIDPTFTSGSELPQARLTLQQQITSDLTFTYITNVTRSDPQIVRVEWAIDDNWSAIATRQENGMVGVDLFFKKRFP